MRTVQTDDGVQLAYRTFGEGPLNLLFLHGWGGSGAYFDETIYRIDLTGLRLITFDFRGHGDSEKPDRGYTLGRIAQDAFAVADAAGASEVVVVGFSMGGKFAQYLPLLTPKRVRGLVLVGGLTAGTFPLPSETRAEWLGMAGNRQAFLDGVRPFLAQPVAPETLERFAVNAAKVSPVALDGTLRLCTEASFGDRVGDIRCPVVVVGGLRDPMLPPDALREGVAKPFARARVSWVDCGHEIPIERPLEMAALIEAFVAALR